MDKSNKVKNYLLVSGLNFQDNNRGTAALGYGAFSFLRQKGYLRENDTILSIKRIKNIFKHKLTPAKVVQKNGQNDFQYVCLNVFFIEAFLYERFKILIPFTPFGKIIKKIRFVAAINGGDGFADIYGEKRFYSRLHDIVIARNMHLPYIFLPQTIGPFSEGVIYEYAKEIMKDAETVYVRDNRFEYELKMLGVNFEIAKDLSAYMAPEPFDISIKKDSIGLNVSGLAYFNKYNELANHFNAYPKLIDAIIEFFSQKNITIYLIPHSYNYENPEANNDDMEACKIVYHNSKHKANIVFVNNNLTPPQVKYVISEMSFFIGTRMHANFAAIFTNVPLFGLSYSFKFAGAFESNGISTSNIYEIKDLKEKDIAKVVDAIAGSYYNR